MCCGQRLFPRSAFRKPHRRNARQCGRQLSADGCSSPSQQDAGVAADKADVHLNFSISTVPEVPARGLCRCLPASSECLLRGHVELRNPLRFAKNRRRQSFSCADQNREYFRLFCRCNAKGRCRPDWQQTSQKLAVFRLPGTKPTPLTSQDSAR